MASVTLFSYIYSAECMTNLDQKEKGSEVDLALQSRHWFIEKCFGSAQTPSYLNGSQCSQQQIPWVSAHGTSSKSHGSCSCWMLWKCWLFYLCSVQSTVVETALIFFRKDGEINLIIKTIDDSDRGTFDEVFPIEILKTVRQLGFPITSTGAGSNQLLLRTHQTSVLDIKCWDETLNTVHTLQQSTAV